MQMKNKGINPMYLILSYHLKLPYIICYPLHRINPIYLILFLQETRLQAKVMEKYKYSLGFDSYLAVSSEGRSGGLALFWTKKFQISIHNFSKSHIHGLITNSESSDHDAAAWYLTGIYGHPDVARREETWDLIISLRVSADQEWLMMGGFNEILSNYENIGGRDRAEKQKKAFRQMVDDCEVQDLGFIGNPFTWWNGREVLHSISVRLDRFLANVQWKSKNPMAKFYHGMAPYSDHVPIILRQDARSHCHRNKIFKFEAMWTDDPGCRKVIEQAWFGLTGTMSLSTIMAKIQLSGGATYCLK